MLSGFTLSLLLACRDKVAPDDSAAPDTACPDGGAPATWYADGDADGHGDPLAGAVSCEQPPFTVSAGDDCDDTDPSARPGASEACDGVDDDCDGEVDEGLETGAWWEDADGDGYGDPATYVTGCLPPDHPVENGEDCDDADAATYPGAPETCGDGVRNDCGAGSGACVLTGERSLEGALSVLVGEAEDARAGQALSSAGDVDGDGVPDLLVGAPEDPEGGISAGAVYLVLGPPPAELDLGEAASKLTGERRAAYAGYAVAGVGDVDGDEVPDLLVGAPGLPTDAGGQGLAALVLGPPPEALELSEADARLLGGAGSGLAGAAVAGAGDLDGDGWPDLLVGDPYASVDVLVAGLVSVVPGPVSGELDLGEATRLSGAEEGDYAGIAVSGAADADGDGVPDLLVGAAYQAEAGTEAGAVYLVYGPVTSDMVLADAPVRWLGEDGGDFAGRALCFAGDVDGDGLHDLLVGGAGSDAAGDGAGLAWVLYGPASEGGSLAGAPGRWLGERDHDAAGQEVAGAGDVDGDGLDDLLVGAPGEDSGGAFAGAAYLLLGPASGAASLAEAEAKLIGVTGGDSAGIAVAGAGDVDGDGRDDVLVGAYGVDSAADWAGAVYLVPGGGY